MSHHQPLNPSPALPFSSSTSPPTLTEQGRQRETALRFWLGLHDHPRPAQISLYGKTTVTANVKGTSVAGDLLSVTDLATPLGTYKAATLRTADIRYFVC
ncbi:hypothetical protein DFJ77DRAFT_507662 [Powellomyces hirtus]|nr:hypothetical protein DFJ77DRAFT_507662 [Powellomyces hirtus]